MAKIKLIKKGKSEGADDILAKHAGDYWYHRYYNSMRRLNLHYKLNGKKQPVLRVGGIDVVHVARVLGDALAQVHPELKAGAKKMDKLIDAYCRDHSDENARKFFLNMVKKLVPQAFPGIEVLDVTSAWNKDPDGESEGVNHHPGQPVNKIRTNQDEENGSILSGLLEKNPVWNEIGGGDAADLAASIEKGEWIGIMTGAKEDTDTGWDKYIADTFGPFADFVEGRYIKPDESQPDFRVAQIKFKPLFNRLSTNAKTGLLTDLGDVLKDGYFAESKREGRTKAMGR